MEKYANNWTIDRTLNSDGWGSFKRSANNLLGGNYDEDRRWVPLREHYLQRGNRS